MPVTFARRPIAPTVPDQLLMDYCNQWHALYREWQRRLQYWFGDANHLYRNEIRPLLDRIAATPAETEEGFAAKIAIILDDDLCGFVWSMCEHQGTNRPCLLRGEEPISKGAPAKRGRPKAA